MPRDSLVNRLMSNIFFLPHCIAAALPSLNKQNQFIPDKMVTLFLPSGLLGGGDRSDMAGAVV